MNNKKRRKIAEDTYKKIYGLSFQEITSKFVEVNYPLEELKETDVTKYTNRFKTKVNTIDKSYINTLIDLTNSGYKNIGIMNFSDPFTPSGNWLKGNNYLEDSIARATNMTIAQEKYFEEMYQENRDTNLEGLYTNHYLLLENVTVFKNDDGKEIEPFLINIVSVPAPNTVIGKKFYWVFDKQFNECIQLRIDNALSGFLEMGSKNIILGAFGCGVLGNNPKDVALITKRLLAKKYSGCFETVTFSVMREKNNYEIFKRYFPRE